jgi:cobalt-zinc-cadmium efflux system membrane fusion protein
VVFPAGSAQLASIVSVPVAARREAVLRFSGRIVWDEDRTVRVFSPLAGRVLSIAVRAGDTVKAGQVLATLSAPELGQAQSDARRAEQDYLLAQKNLARVEELHGAGVAPAKDLQASQADVARAAAERERTSARLRLYGAAGNVDQRFDIRAPIAGLVVERNLNPGQELRPDAPPPGAGLFVLSDPAKLWFILDVGEAEIGRVTPGTEVQLGATALGTDRMTGRVAHVADVVDPQTRTVKVRGTVENANRRLKAEMFATAELRVPSTSGVLVPVNAVYLRGERYFAFVEAGAGRYVRHTLRLGPAFDGMQVVLDGVAANQRVVTDGNLLLERLLAEKD